MDHVLKDPFILWYLVRYHTTTDPKILYGLLIVFKNLREYIQTNDLIDQLYNMHVKYKTIKEKLIDKYRYFRGECEIDYYGYLPNGNKHGVHVTANSYNDECTYTEIRNDKYHGLFVCWDDHGVLEKVEYGKDGRRYYGLRLGYDIIYLERGYENKLISIIEDNYSNGQLRLSSEYDIKTGQILEEYHWDDNLQLTGPGTRWKPNGDLHSICNYSKGEQDGKQYYFDGRGGLSRYAEYKNGDLLCEIVWGFANGNKLIESFRRYHRNTNYTNYTKCDYNNDGGIQCFEFKNAHENYRADFDSNGEITEVKYEYKNWNK